MKHLLALVTKWSMLLLAFLKPWGVWGAWAIAVLDSSTIPVPMDLLMAGYYWTDRRHAWAYVLMGAFGSAVGGLLPFLLGRAGGELFLLKRIDRARYEKLRNRFEKQEFLALLIPSMLPPPTPWKLFAFAGGVFEVRVLTFMLAVFCGRIVRFGATAVLTVLYGPRFIAELGGLLHRHAHALFTVLGLVVLVGARWGVRQGRGRRRDGASGRASGGTSSPTKEEIKD